MKKIQKTIALEKIMSRVPSVWPAYKDGKLYYFDDTSIKERQNLYTSNYGMIPLNVICSGTTMSFERLSNRYAFMKQYYHLLEHEGHCGLSYTSATSFYDTEINSKYGNELPYGTNRITYEELDNTFNEYSGESFYNWVCEKVIPTYKISDDYKDYWKRDVLYYPDVIKWIPWFEKNKGYEETAHYSAKTENDIEHWDCQSSGVSNCCECEEYFNRGGKRQLDAMITWYETVQSAISDNNHEISSNLSAYTPYLDDKIELSNSLTDVGQFSVLSPDLEMGKEYRTIPTEITNEKTLIHYESGNTHSGTTVIDGEDSLILLSGNGFCYSSDYMEMLFKEEDWGNYTELYIKDNPSEFISSAYTHYAFDDNNVMYTGNTIEEVSSAMSSVTYVSVNPTEATLINGALYNVETHEYGDYTNQLGIKKTYFVERDEKTNTPYVIMNGNTVYADSYLDPISGFCYYFSFFKTSQSTENKPCHSDGVSFDINDYKIFKRGTISDTTTNLKYNGKLYSASTFQEITIGGKTYTGSTYSGFTIDGIVYPLISGYSIDINGNSMYIVNNIEDVFDSNLMQIDNVYFKDNNIYMNKYNQDVKIYTTNELVGTTSSKLSSLKANNVLVDDIGNKIDGLYNDTCRKINNLESGGTYAQPPSGTTLEPSYQIGNVSLLAKLQNLTKETPTDVNYCIGNILTDMTFYYKDVNGNIVEGTKISCSNEITSLSAITNSTNEKKKIESSGSTVFDENLYCDIKYYIGATLEKVKGQKFQLAYSANTANTESDNYNYGVEYNETVRFTKKQVFYYLTKEEEQPYPTEVYSPKNTNVKYPIYIYDIEQDVDIVENDIYNTQYTTPLANFKTEINIFKKDLIPTYSGYTDMNTYEGIKASPVYKEEYRMGQSSMENLDTDIYIDRGMNSAFERHLKLGEVTSMEALENYGNNFFKIMES